jgi:hypothetical protein
MKQLRVVDSNRLDDALDLDIGSNVIIEVDTEPLVRYNSFITRKVGSKFVKPASVSVQGLRKRFGRGHSSVSSENLVGKTADVIRVTPKERERMLAKVQVNIEEFSDLLINEIAVFEVSMLPAVNKARQKLSIVLGQDLDEVDSVLGMAQKATTDIINLRIIDYVCRKLSVSTDIRRLVLSRHYKDPESGIDQLLRQLSKPK